MNNAEKSTGEYVFDDSLGQVSLRFYLGVRALERAKLAEVVLETVNRLKALDGRALEWFLVAEDLSAAAPVAPLPSDIAELAMALREREQRDESGSLVARWGTAGQVGSSVLRGDRASVGPSFSFKDGDEATDRNVFRAAFENVSAENRASIVNFFERTVELWQPERGGIFSLQVTRQTKGQKPWYPPIGVVTYFAKSQNYVLPDTNDIAVSAVGDGRMAVLRDWTADAVLAYAAAFNAANASTTA